MVKKKVFYGWYLCFALLLMLIGGTGIVNNSASQFMKPLCNALNISRAQFSLYLSFMTIALMIICPYIGKIYNKWNPKMITILSGSLMAIAWSSLSFVNSARNLYLLGFIIGIALTFVSLVTVNIVISNWFHEKKGLAMGIALTGSGIGSMIFNPVASKLIMDYGYQSAYRILGVVSILCMFPLFVIYRYKPEDIGLVPLGKSNKKLNSQENSSVDNVGTMYKDAIKTKMFWAICFIAFGLSASTMGIYSQMMAYFTDIGYEQMMAAKIISLMGLCLAFGKLIYGWLNDKLGEKVNFTIILSIALTSIILLYLSKNIMIAFIAAVLFGLSLAAPFILVPLVTIASFGQNDFVNIYGTVTSCMFLGPSVAIPLSGWIYDVQGSYNSAFVLYFIVLVIVFIIGQNILNKKNKVKVEHYYSRENI